MVPPRRIDGTLHTEIAIESEIESSNAAMGRAAAPAGANWQ